MRNVYHRGEENNRDREIRCYRREESNTEINKASRRRRECHRKKQGVIEGNREPQRGRECHREKRNFIEGHRAPRREPRSRREQRVARNRHGMPQEHDLDRNPLFGRGTPFFAGRSRRRRGRAFWMTLGNYPTTVKGAAKGGFIGAFPHSPSLLVKG